MQENQKPSITSTADLQREVAELMVECLNLEVAADQITPDAPLYGDGLGLELSTLGRERHQHLALVLVRACTLHQAAALHALE